MFPAALKLLPGARTNHAYYAFFRVADTYKKHSVSGIETLDVQQAQCTIKDSKGKICGRFLQQSHTTSSGLRSHLSSKHQHEEALVAADEKRKKAELDGTWNKIKHLYEAAGGVHETQEDVDAAAKDLGKTNSSSAFLLNLCFCNDLSCRIRYC